ncbi:glycosyl transferase family 64 domain-containing protein [Lipomyces japonicus]|uniref:glycosyl transferase family 64 domain-containing protein n=1 Tax=Lipomyces japonicus TaxID=56871 RepID=UPI0034CDDF1F
MAWPNGKIKRILRPRFFFLIAINVFTIIGFLAWRERYVTKESLLQLMDDRLKAVFSSDRDITQIDDVPGNFTGKAAFVTSICLHDDFVPVRTLVHSIAETKTTADILVLVINSLSETERNQLTTLGAKLVDTSLINVDIEDVPTSEQEKAVQDEKIKKQKESGLVDDSKNERRVCKINFIQAWRLTEYDRLLFVQPETLVLQNIDEVFQEVPFAATLELGGIIDDSIMLVQPSMELYKELKNVLVKSWQVPNDIGFLNYFFKDIHPLNPVYNVKAKYLKLEYSNYIFGNAKVYNYEGTMKPWNFWHAGPKGWRDSFQEDMIFRWRQADYSAKDKLDLDPELTEWRKDRGSNDVCKDYLKDKLEISERINDKYSVLLATHSLRRQETLPFVVNQFLMSPNVDKIFIVWHDKNQQVSKNIRELVERQTGTVILLNQTVDSLNNRFNPVKELRTGAVLISDDDVWTPIEDIDLAFEAWQRQPDSLVGFAPRADCYDHNSETIKYCWAYRMSPPRYSIILTKLMFMDANFLFLWRCGLPDNILKYVDDLINCEDIAMNFLISGVTNQPPFHVVSEEVYDFGLEHGISSNPNHWRVRGECVQQITNLFERNTLLSVKGSMSRYEETDFKSTNWGQFLDMIREKESNAQKLDALDTIPIEDQVANDW